MSATSVTNVSLFAIADYCHQLSSLSVVDCKVNYLGLMNLGRQEHRCCSTLRDLHISVNMQYARNFYGELYHTFTKRLAVEHPVSAVMDNESHIIYATNFCEYCRRLLSSIFANRTTMKIVHLEM